MTNSKQTFGRALKEARSKIQLSQVVIAEKIGIKVTALSRYERGDVLPSIEIAAKLATALNCSLDELCGLKENTQNPMITDIVNTINKWNNQQLTALNTLSLIHI